MEFFKKQTDINFMGIRKYTGFVVILLAVISVWLLANKGLNFGLDFTGGTQIEARFTDMVDPNEIREELETQGLHGVRVQQYGSTQDILIRIPNPKDNPEGEQAVASRVKTVLSSHSHQVEIRRTEFVGSEVGEQLIEQGGLAVFASILAMMIYIGLRFEYRLAVAAAVGLCHDAILILGIFSLFSFEFDLAAMASVLAVLGYSLNDTIVVFDRVRENFRKLRKGIPAEVMNISINQTLSRTIMTSWLTLLVVLALLFFGGTSLFSFSIAFFIGIIIGTFSSIYVSGALALWLGVNRGDLLPKPKLVDDRP